MSGDIFYFHKWMEVLLASHGHRSRMSLNILQCTGQPLTAKNYQTQSVNTTEAEKPWSTGNNTFYHLVVLCKSYGHMPSLSRWGICISVLPFVSSFSSLPFYFKGSPSKALNPMIFQLKKPTFNSITVYFSLYLVNMLTDMQSYIQLLTFHSLEAHRIPLSRK